MSDALGLLVDAAKAIFDLREKIKTNDKARKTAVAEYYLDISKTIQDAASKFRNDEIPHGSCAKMEALALILPQTIGDFIGKQQALELQDTLMKAHNVERFMYDIPRKNKREKEASLAKMEQAAGFFEATAASLKASR